MKGILFFPVFVISLAGYSQTLNPDSLEQDSIPYVGSFNDYLGDNGDTLINFNSLNNGIQKYQVSEESQKKLADNGLEIKDGGIVTVIDDEKLHKNFSFDVKTFASDNEWYENTVKIEFKDGSIYLVHVSSDKIEMATGFRKDGKIYVVIAVSMILFFIIITYLVVLERKTKKLEKKLGSN